MKPTDFAGYLTGFLSSYLPGQRNLSKHTIQSYRDTFQLLLTFCRDVCKIPIEKITLGQIDKGLVEDFLVWLETDRGNSISTRNQRLAALHSFFRYVQFEAPETMLHCQRVLGIPFKKKPKPAITHLTADEIRAIFEGPDTSKKDGRRDLLLLSLLYDTGGRVSEISDLEVRDVRLDSPATITLNGKGGKIRYVPIMSKTADLLSVYLHEQHLLEHSRLENPLFFNRQKRKLTRMGVTYVLDKYVELARTKCPSMPEKVTPDSFRHSKAMHLLESGVNLVYIRDLLGHSSVMTTEIYARANAEMKRKALEQAHVNLIPVHADEPAWEDDSSLVSWLQNLCR